MEDHAATKEPSWGIEVVAELESLFVVMAVAALTPVLVRLLPFAVPQVVILLAGGVLVGPEVLNWAHYSHLELLANLGLGFLFLLAGYELPPLLLRQRPGRLALRGWLISVVLALAVVGLLEVFGFVRSFIPVALALTTTALGTLLPILRDNNMLSGTFGQHMFAAGAVGELGPVLALSVFLGANGSWESALAITTVVVSAWIAARIPTWVAGTRISEIVTSTSEDTTQSVLRWTITLLLGALLLTADFGLDIVLGAFLAGMVLRRSGDHASGTQLALLGKLDTVAYGFFIPIFFITSGMELDIVSIAENPARLLVFFVLLLVVRGAPALLIYRRDLRLSERWQLLFLSATALPLIVALTQIGLENGTMLPENAAALVGAGALSVAVFPLVAIQIRRRTAQVSV
ncbi:MAG TPA: cation:proton antiporter [Actinomycetes bacterium]|nr:cation:proton antiporter [Actinomycetes bacterium]